MGIDSTRNYQRMAEDMVAEALFPTLSVYTTFGVSTFATAQKLKGALDFDWYTSDAGFPLIRWRCLGFTGPDPWATTVYSVGLNCEVAVAHKGQRDHDGTADTSAHQECERDLGSIRQALMLQFTDANLTAGPFGISNTSVVQGQGSSPMSCVTDISIGEGVVEQVLSEGDEDNLGPNTWIGTVPFTITVLVY